MKCLWRTELHTLKIQSRRPNFHGADLKLDALYAVYLGEKRYPLAKGVEAISVAEFLPTHSPVPPAAHRV